MISMKKAGSWVLIFALSISFSYATQAKGKSDVESLRAVDLAWQAAYTSGNAEGIANLYDEKAVLLAPGAPAASGKEAIKNFFVKSIADTSKEGLKFALGEKYDGGISGNMGWSSGTYSATDKMGKVVETGKYLSVYVKNKGKWHYLRDTWNSDIPSPMNKN